ncbi:MAG: bifunctional metallophosphatase/5'-nucleotidase [Bacteroidia bacterium]
MNKETDSPRDQHSRRDFLRKSALLGLSAGIAPFAFSKPEETDKPEATSPLTDVPTSTITILYTADIHAQLNTHDEFFWEEGKAVYRKRGGLATLKSMIDTLRKTNPYGTLLIDGGDYYHGHAVASLTEGEALIPVFNAFHYDLMLPGNWEVVYKKKKMLFDLGHSEAAKTCANMWHQSNDEYNGDLIYQPYWVKMLNGVKMGFIGYTDHLIPKRQSPAYSEGIRFEHAEKSVAKYVKYLREYEACQLVFLVTHMGLAQQVGLGNNPVCEGVDFILGADTHERVREPIQCKYTKVVECGAFGSFIGKLDITLEEGKVRQFSYALLDVDPVRYGANEGVQRMIDDISKPYEAELKKVLGYSTTPLVRYFVMETPMDNFLTDAIMWKFKPDVALSNGFRFCQPLNVDPATGKAAITKEFLWNMLPVNSEAKRGIVTGQQILDWLEKELQNAFAKDPSKRFGGWFVRYAGMEVNFTINNEFGKRVNTVKIKGKPLEKEKEYSIVACEREGDPDDTLCRIEKVKSPQKTGSLMHAVIEEYLAAKKIVSPKIEGRATATDFPSTLLTQLQGTTYEFR